MYDAFTAENYPLSSVSEDICTDILYIGTYMDYMDGVT